MSNTLIFKEQDLQKGEEYFKSIHIELEQRQIVVGIAQLMSKYTGIREIALKGFILMVFREWQLDNNQEIRVIATSPPPERIKIVTNLFERLNRRLAKILKSEDDRNNLTKAINSALEYYITNFANR